MGGAAQAQVPFAEDGGDDLAMRPMFAPLASRRDAFASDRQFREVWLSLIDATVRLGGGLHTKERSYERPASTPTTS